MDAKTLKTLRAFFTASTAAFAIAAIYGGNYSPMRELHEKALTELKKDELDTQVLDALFAEMESMAGSLPIPKYPAGTPEMGGIATVGQSGNEIFIAAKNVYVWH